MKKCIHCGAELHDDASFCHLCAKNQREKRNPALPKPKNKKLLRALLSLALAVCVLFAISKLLPREEAPAEPTLAAQPEVSPELSADPSAEPSATPSPEPVNEPQVFDNGGAEMRYDSDEGSYCLMLSYSRLVKQPEEMIGVLRNDQTVSPGTQMFMPSFVFITNGDKSAFAEDEFEELVADIRISCSPAEGSEALQPGLPELHPEVPEVFRACFIAYSDLTSDNDICWEIELLNGDIIRLHQRLIVNTVPTAEYHFSDYPMNTVEELRALLDSIRSDVAPETEITLYLPPVIYEGSINLDSHSFVLVGSSDAAAGIERTTFLGTVAENSPGTPAGFINIAFMAEGGVGLHAKHTVMVDTCAFIGCDIGVYCEGEAWICPSACYFSGNGVGIEINNLSKAKAMTPDFRGHIFEDNAVAFRISACSYPDTLHFDQNVFNGNGQDVENLCGQPIEFSDAITG